MGGKRKKKVSQEPVITEYLERNQDAIGYYFKELLRNDLRKWEKWSISILVRSRAYASNDSKKLLELAQDLRDTYQAQVDFVDKYAGDLFSLDASAMEQEVTKLMDIKVIPYLRDLPTKIV